jgi:hypothetical protein
LKIYVDDEERTTTIDEELDEFARVSEEKWKSIIKRPSEKRKKYGLSKLSIKS